jgi:hypothetical protein
MRRGLPNYVAAGFSLRRHRLKTCATKIFRRKIDWGDINKVFMPKDFRGAWPTMHNSSITYGFFG